MLDKVTASIAAQGLLTALKAPEKIADFDTEQWDLVIRQARRTRLLSRIAVKAAEHDLGDKLPPKVADILKGAAYVGAENRRMITWEVVCVRKALADCDIPVILLKGAAYVAAALPPAVGRLAGDIDIMVPEPRLAEVEEALVAHGWRPIKFSDYDQRYYRKWMHELPPLRHEERRTVIDVHHTILPLTSRLGPDPQKLWQQSLDIPGTGMKMLGAQDMVLHSAAHLFQDGDLAFAIRDLVDLVDLFNHFGANSGFWETLAARAAEHELQRPLYYALRYGKELLDLTVPDTVERSIDSAAPVNLVARLMDRIIPRVLLPDHPDSPSGIRAHAASLLYLRSHWLRMPPWLLAAHLIRKAVLQSAGAVARWHEARQKAKDS